MLHLGGGRVEDWGGGRGRDGTGAGKSAEEVFIYDTSSSNLDRLRL